VAKLRNPTAAIIAITILQLTTHPLIAQPLCNPLTVANAFMAENYPMIDLSSLRPVMSDLGNIWTLTYRLPPHFYGTAPTVIIEKRTCSVVSTQ
jgi:hypothetical protein